MDASDEKVSLDLQILAIERTLRKRRGFPVYQLHLEAALATLRALQNGDDVGLRIAKMQPKAGDFFVVRTEGYCPPEQCYRIKETIERNIPPGVKVMVHGPELDVTLNN